MIGKRHQICFRARVCGIFAVVLSGLLCFTGCSQRELCYDHSHVSPVLIEFDWSQAPDATPKTMVVWFFSTTSDASYRFELTAGGTESRAQFDSRINVRPGTYYVLCHNGTTDNNYEEGRTLDGYRIVTHGNSVLAPMNRSENAPLPDDADSQPVRTQPSTVYSHSLDEPVTIEPAATTEKHIQFTPVEVTSIYDIIITGVKNMTADTEASGVITGLAEAWHPGYSRPTGTEVIIPFKFNHCGPECLRGSLVTFGDNAPHDVKHCLRVYTSYKYYYDFDVTEAIHKAGNSKHIEINLNGLKLPAGGQGGMSPGVGGWEDAEDIEIKM